MRNCIFNWRSLWGFCFLKLGPQFSTSKRKGYDRFSSFVHRRIFVWILISCILISWLFYDTLLLKIPKCTFLTHLFDVIRCSVPGLPLSTCLVSKQSMRVCRCACDEGTRDMCVKRGQPSVKVPFSSNYKFPFNSPQTNSCRELAILWQHINNQECIC